MGTFDWHDLGGAVAALVAVALPLLLARWLIGRDDDDEGPPRRLSTSPPDSAPPRAINVQSDPKRRRS